MPNWCMNTLCVKGPKEDVAEFKKRARYTYEYPDATCQERFSRLRYENEFYKEYSMETKEELGDRLKKGWYALNEAKERVANNKKVAFSFYSFFPKKEIRHWTCIFPRIMEECEDMIKYAFDSKSYPPSSYVEKISMLYPKLYFKIEYIMRDAGCKGFYEFKNGKTVINVEEHFDIEFGLCPSCKEEVGISLLDEHCPSCHKMLDEIIIDDATGETIQDTSDHVYTELGTCPFCEENVAVSLLGKYCPSCHEKLDKLLMDDGLEPITEYLTFGVCAICKQDTKVVLTGGLLLCGSCFHKKMTA